MNHDNTKQLVNTNELLTREQAVNYLTSQGLKVSTQWLARYSGRTIPSYKLGRFVRYKQIDLDTYLNNCGEYTCQKA